MFNFRKPPIILGGCGRSGTTLLLSILSSHPRIFAVPEEMWAIWPTETDEEFSILMEKMNKEISRRDIPSCCHRWCEKTPKNILATGQLLNYFGEEARIIHIVRDGRDVITSRHPSDPTRFCVPVDRWVWDVQTGVEYQHHPNVLTIRYEDIVTRFAETASGICEFINEEWTEKFLDWPLHAKVRRHSAWDGEMQKMSSNSIGRWKDESYVDQVEEFMANPDAVDLLGRLGYV